MGFLYEPVVVVQLENLLEMYILTRCLRFICTLIGHFYNSKFFELASPVCKYLFINYIHLFATSLIFRDPLLSELKPKPRNQISLDSEEYLYCVYYKAKTKTRKTKSLRDF